MTGTERTVHLQPQTVTLEVLFWTGIRIGRIEEEKSAGETWRIVKRREVE